MTLKGFTFDTRLTSAVCATERGETSYLPALGEGKRPGGIVQERNVRFP